MLYYGATMCAILASAASALPSGRVPQVEDSKSSLPPHASGDYENVDMQCVSEFNWNQGEQEKGPTGGPYKSATGYFIGRGAGIQTNDIPDCAGGWSAKDDTLTLKGTVQPRMFLKDATNKLVMLDMKSETISWTQNVAQLGRQFNGALYTTWVRDKDQSDPATAAKLYCDANDGTGNNLWCPEMDLGESNMCGFRSTSHPTTDLGANGITAYPWTADAVNCHLPLAAEVGTWYNKTSGASVANADYTNLFYCGLGKPTAQKVEAGHPKQTWVDHFGNALYMSSESAVPGCSQSSDTKCGYGVGETIDTTLDYDVSVAFDWDQADGYLRGFTTTLTQGGKNLSISRVASPNQAEVPIKGGFPDDGRVALLVQLWTSQGEGMSWLSGVNCNYTNGQTAGLPPIGDTTYTMKNIQIKDTQTGAVKRIKFKTVA
jgi:hypothetical protein